MLSQTGATQRVAPAIYGVGVGLRRGGQGPLTKKPLVSSQTERSQHRNRELAMKVLRARLYNLEKRKRDQKKADAQESQKDIAWGSQIRSYVLQPYRLVKDHRTKHEEGNVDAVLDGNLDRFVEAYLLNPGEE